MAGILKDFKQHLLLNQKLDWAETYWEALEQHKESELLKSFCSASQDGRLGGHLENLETTSAPEPCQMKPKLVGWHWSHMRFRIAKIIPFWYTTWLPCWPSWKSSNDISSQTVSRFELKLDGSLALEQHRDSEWLKSFRSDIQDGHHDSHLENLQTTSAPKGNWDWA